MGRQTGRVVGCGWLDFPRALSALVADGLAAAGHSQGGSDAGREVPSASLTIPARVTGGSGRVTVTAAVERLYPLGGGVSETVSIVQPSIAVGLVHDRRWTLGVAGCGGWGAVGREVSDGVLPAATISGTVTVDGAVGVCQGVPYWKGVVKVGAASVPAAWARRLGAAQAAAAAAADKDGSSDGGVGGGGGGGGRPGPLQAALTARAGTASQGLPPHERTAAGGG